MAANLTTPGVYIEDKSAFSGSVVAVETAIPVFIGYTERAGRTGKSLLHQATRISSLAEYVEYFGGAFRPVYTLGAAGGNDSETFLIHGRPSVAALKANNSAYFYNSIRLFYANGGGTCYILPVGTYGDKPDGFEIRLDDFTGTGATPNVFELLEKEFEPTLVVLPDAIALGAAAYGLYQQVLLHCQKVGNRFGIFDVALQGPAESTAEVISAFREGIGTNALSYGAAYYPWLRTTVVQPSELDYRNIDPSADLATLLPEPGAGEIVRNFRALAPEQVNDSMREKYHQALQASSPTYINILAELCRQINLLPPSPALAGLYTLVDTTRGVWKAPANVSVSRVSEPAQTVSDDQQQSLNVDPTTGKSINVIRSFRGVGTLVWGARTLDGNSSDWRYINVRRTVIMIEQSLKLAVRAYAFEPNTAATWTTVSSMINNFLFSLWKIGALAGAEPSQAYDVQVGLGSTMTPNDILDGILRVTVKVAVVRPAEFILLTFEQRLQQSQGT